MTDCTDSGTEPAYVTPGTGSSSPTWWKPISESLFVLSDYANDFVFSSTSFNRSTVPGLDEMPDMSTKGWVVTNAGGHGYGCACLDLEIDPRVREVVRIVAARPLPLKRCKADRTLRAP
ncbi:DUF4087 domain-containing protein [Burkholderia lata]|uniref:DUF4087 domain-containing protein n=1 Tax=Burkholderia lata (strain ATCC 17760 / DSM 23089 / LMG 22485 / NCIMB 9086 / R18194 / 383) TaxID=482957 RepID=UPI003F689A2A